jgi:hypothetical protein
VYADRHGDKSIGVIGEEIWKLAIVPMDNKELV